MALRWRAVCDPYEALAAAIVLHALREWRRGDGDREELAAFFRSPWCASLCDEGGIDYRALLRQTVGT